MRILEQGDGFAIRCPAKRAFGFIVSSSSFRICDIASSGETAD
jgi:hypothetical protein